MDEALAIIVESLISDTGLPTDQQLHNLFTLLPPGIEAEILKRRWSGILLSFNGKFAEGRAEFETSLANASAEGLDVSLLHELYLDIRTLTIQESNYTGRILDVPFKDELRKSRDCDKTTCVDNLMLLAHQEWQNDFFSSATDSKYAIRFGGNLESCLSYLSKSLAYAIMTGSLNALHVIRNNIARIFFAYYGLHKDELFLGLALRVAIIEGSYSDVGKDDFITNRPAIN